MTSTQPSVSTAGNRRITADCFDIREMPIASETVTTAGSPSGMAATARLMPESSISRTSSPRRIPVTVTHAQMSRQQTRMTLPRLLSRFCSGVCSTAAEPSSEAILPISVRMPVAVTTASPRPAVTSVPMYTALADRLLRTGMDSPVSIDSSQARPLQTTSAPSAPIRSPSSNSRRSPATSSADGISRSAPSRKTRAVGALMAFSRSSAFSVRYSCTTPSSALINTIASTENASVNWRISALTMAAPMSTRTI